MNQDATIPFVEEIMADFARRTGLEPTAVEPRRYLWTDAFAVCNYLSLFRLTEEERFRALALRLVDQVHSVLGRHRGDDRRQGWISGLDEEEGAKHPTASGLRIGKRLRERGRNEAPDPFLEWEQDGQYYHYLTKWMHALSRVSEVTGDPRYLRWALEMARGTHPRFTYSPSSHRERRMYWKMSIDLSYPLVTSMGQHDALDGYVTYCELRHASGRFEGADLPGLGPEIEDMAGICRGGGWATDDALGAGALLIDAWRVAQMYDDGDLLSLLKKITSASLVSVGAIAGESDIEGSAGQRLAFRELGLVIGLDAVEPLGAWLREGAVPTTDGVLAEQVDLLVGFVPLAKKLERFWTDPRNRLAATWKDHEDINAVMLATSLAPSEFLRI
jgi:hypothetical protein